MISALIFMILLASLSLVLASVLMAQVVPAQLASKSTRTVYAAESGMQAALGILRTAAAAPDITGTVYGDKSKLPCTKTGTVDGDPNGANYKVTIAYYLEDPAPKPDTWKASNQLACVSGAGVSVQPKFALISSQGMDTPIAKQSPTFGDRSLSAVYEFPLSNVNVAGGYVYAYGTSVCLQAEGTAAGSLIRYQAPSACNRPDMQKWVYDTTYQIKLASTMVAGSPTQMCITGPGTSGANERATLQPCRPLADPARWNQLWSYQGGEIWKGESQSIDNYSTVCLYSGQKATAPDGGTSGTPPTPTYLWTGPQCASSSAWGSFTPSPSVGAGPAGLATQQVVNYKEFGRCLDVTDTILDSAFMIAYPCKQDPSGGSKLDWNHKWTYLEPPAGVDRQVDQQITVTKGSETRCFQAPTVASGSIYPIFKACDGSALQKWTRVYKSTTYAASFLFIDNLGRCLSVDPSVLYKGASKVVIATCSGGTDQKWNAPPDATASSFGGFRELGG